MRGILASSIGVTCAAALALPLAPPAAAADPGPARTAEAATRAAVTARHDVPGSTQSLPLRPSPATVPAPPSWASPPVRTALLLLGVIWDDPADQLHGRVQVRTRTAGTGGWTGWRDVETHYTDHGADPDSAEGSSDGVRGATAPLWVGDSDGVEVRVQPEPGAEESRAEQPGSEETAAGEPEEGDHSVLPSGLRLELVDPGDDTQESPRSGLMSAEATAASAANSALAPLGATEIPALNGEQTREELLTLRGAQLTERQRAESYIGPRPAVVTRRGWGANESLREKRFVYTSKVKAAFVHHTASGNGYKCSQGPALVRGFYRYHVSSLGWRDIGYNFLVDKCGRIYEGRAGEWRRPSRAPTRSGSTPTPRASR
ncbi:hypothetical protein SHKM778_85090 [Streptomyces sp. KM77-8]|uniref:Peptidoglycan recognition protein family domain-containing protein n=1 Tax=Streptomyces haneummycinicus TaxID=3074435 RepID=A0AAT9HYF2_9ACTN